MPVADLAHSVSFIHSANAKCPTDARRFLSPRETTPERPHSLPQGTYSLEEEDQQVSKIAWEGAETTREAGQDNMMAGVL